MNLLAAFFTMKPQRVVGEENVKKRRLPPMKL